MLREAHLGIQTILVRLAIYYSTVLLQTQLRKNRQYI